MAYKYIPNALSIFRIVITPLFIFLLIKNQYIYNVISLVLFLAGSLSDVLDGYVARKYQYVTNFGKYLDPIADKILVLSGFIIFHIFYYQYIKLWMILVIFIRDFIVSLFRLILLKKNIVMQTSKFAKYKTLSQIILIHIILILHTFCPHLINKLEVGSLNIIYLLTLLCSLYTLITGIHYFIINKFFLYE